MIPRAIVERARADTTEKERDIRENRAAAAGSADFRRDDDAARIYEPRWRTGRTAVKQAVSFAGVAKVPGRRRRSRDESFQLHGVLSRAIRSSLYYS